MDISGGIQASLAGRYAIALFELANEQGQLDAGGESLAALKQALADSDDFRALTTSPLIGRDPLTTILATFGVGSLVYGIVTSSDAGWGSVQTIAALVLATR